MRPSRPSTGNPQTARNVRLCVLKNAQKCDGARRILKQAIPRYHTSHGPFLGLKSSRIKKTDSSMFPRRMFRPFREGRKHNPAQSSAQMHTGYECSSKPFIWDLTSVWDVMICGMDVSADCDHLRYTKSETFWAWRTERGSWLLENFAGTVFFFRKPLLFSRRHFFLFLVHIAHEVEHCKKCTYFSLFVTDRPVNLYR